MCYNTFECPSERKGGQTLARIIPITEFRNRARELLTSLEDRPVVLRYEDYEAREEYIHHLEMERDRQLLLEAKATATEFVPLEEAFAEYEQVTGYNLDEYKE